MVRGTGAEELYFSGHLAPSGLTLFKFDMSSPVQTIDWFTIYCRISFCPAIDMHLILLQSNTPKNSLQLSTLCSTALTI
jgi:hypothetical protein